MEALIACWAVWVSNLETEIYYWKDNSCRVMCISHGNVYNIVTHGIANTSLLEQRLKSLFQNLTPGIDLILYLHVTLSKVITNIRFLIWYQSDNKCRKNYEEVSNKQIHGKRSQLFIVFTLIRWCGLQSDPWKSTRSRIREAIYVIIAIHNWDMYPSCSLLSIPNKLNYKDIQIYLLLKYGIVLQVVTKQIFPKALVTVMNLQFS